MTRKARPKQMWRPPSAADHNAMAAAGDMYRRGPDATPTKATPKDVLVKTPVGGIAARNGTTIYSSSCTRIVETSDGTAGERELVETTETLEVFNIYPDAVTGEVIVPTSLTIWGTRYVTGEPCS